MYLLLTDIFKEIQPINEQVDSINCGGCGVFAEHLYDLFIKLGHKPELAIITNSKKDMDKRVKGIPWENYPSITHIVVKVDKYYMDNSGVFDKIEDVPGYGFWGNELCTDLTIETLKEWTSWSSLWNDTFDRKHIKTIAKKINEVYEKFAQLEK